VSTRHTSINPTLANVAMCSTHPNRMRIAGPARKSAARNLIACHKRELHVARIGCTPGGESPTSDQMGRPSAYQRYINSHSDPGKLHSAQRSANRRTGHFSLPAERLVRDTRELTEESSARSTESISPLADSRASDSLARRCRSTICAA
jgi:hypothetical protein